jgi:drug/metabolite transporter (DMT)-like permease
MLVILAALGFVSTVIPLYALSAAIVRIGSARASVLGMVGPIIAVGLCVLLLGERLNPVQWAGAATVMGGVALAGRRKPAVGEK